MKSSGGFAARYSLISAHVKPSTIRCSSSNVRAVEVIPFAGDRRSPRKARFLLHDKLGLDAGLEPVELARLDAARETAQFGKGNVERFLGGGVVPA